PRGRGAATAFSPGRGWWRPRRAEPRRSSAGRGRGPFPIDHRVTNGTYVFCLVSSARAPRIDRGLRGLQGMGAIRALPIDRGLFAIAADAPLARYGEAAVNRGLANIDWVSRPALAPPQ